ncbi:MAG: autotransporter-associated beta strand repeat-containing protein [Verrucomicrobia bacterium]|nr:autotransporter-associated beta strand repeat-containing protein [Verrucomicrobiota bacterium]
MRNLVSTSLGLLLVASFGLKALDAAAQTTTFWDGGSTGDSGFWSLGSNWSGDSVPPNAADSDVVFNNRNGTGTLVNMTVSGTRVFGLLTFDNINARLPASLAIDTNSTGSTSRSLTLHKGITLQNTTTSVVFTGANGILSVLLGADNTFTTSAGSILQFGSAVAISGAFRITKEGLGTLILDAANSFTGGVTINAGTLKITKGTALGTLPASYSAGQVILNGGTLEYASDSNFTSGGNRGFSIGNGGGTIRVSGAGGFTISSIVADLSGQSGTLTKTGQGTLTLDEASTYSGGTTIASGTLRVGVSGALGAASGVVNLGSIGGGDASLINYLGGYTFANDINVVAGSGGVLTLGYTSGASFSSRFSGKITLNDDLVLYSQSVDTFSLRISGAISGSKNLTKTGTGIVRVEDNNTGYSGTTTISEGVLQLGALGGGTTGALGSGNVIDNATLLVNRSNACALTNQISGTGSLIQMGDGTTTLSNANTYSGGTTVISGSLLATNTTGSATGSGAVVTSFGTIMGGTGIIAPTGSNGITVGGNVAPGSTGSNNGVGTLTFTPVDGNVTFQSSSSITWDLSANHVNDKIVFAASGAGRMDFSAMTAGSLAVAFVGGYIPSLNDSFDLLDWTAVSGLSTTLLNLTTTGLNPSWTWDTSQFTRTGVISITSLAPEPAQFWLLLIGMKCVLLRRRRAPLHG